MKPLPAVAAGMLAAFLLLSPAIVTAAAPTIMVSPTSVSGSQLITISGTTTASATVGIKVTNPNGVTVDVANVVADSSGNYQQPPFAAGGSSSWITGTYTATATVASQTGTATFTYTAAPPAPTGNALAVLASASSPVYAGQTAQVQAYVYWSANGTAASSAVTVTAWWVNPAGAVSASTAGTSDGSGFWTWSIPLSASASDGSYSAVVKASSGAAWGYGTAGFTVNSQVASAGGLATLTSGISKNFTATWTTMATDFSTTWTAISSSQTAITSAISSSQTAITSAISSSQSAITAAISSATTGLAKSSDVSAATTAVEGAITSATSGLATASSVSTLSSTVTAGFTSVTNAIGSLPTTAQFNALGSQVTALGTQVTNANNSISSTSLYVLVVAVLAAITLVLELAILVRKLS